MPVTKEHKKDKAAAFTKKKTDKSSFVAKIEKANDLLGRAIFSKKSTAGVR